MRPRMAATGPLPCAHIECCRLRALRIHRSLPGDYGFDPLGLGKEPAALKWCAAFISCIISMAPQPRVAAKIASLRRVAEHPSMCRC